MLSVRICIHKKICQLFVTTTSYNLLTIFYDLKNGYNRVVKSTIASFPILSDFFVVLFTVCRVVAELWGDFGVARETLVPCFAVHGLGRYCVRRKYRIAWARPRGLSIELSGRADIGG